MSSLPVIETLDVFLSERRLLKMVLHRVDEEPRVLPKPVCCRVFCQNRGTEAVRIIGAKWIIQSRVSKTKQVIENDQVFNTRPLMQGARVLAFSTRFKLDRPGALSLTLLVRDEAGRLYQSRTATIKLR